MILDQELLTVDDVLLEPALGILKSRSDAKLRQFIYSDPMDTVTGYELACEMIQGGEVPVICRELSDEEYCKCLKEFQGKNAFFAVGATKSELQRFLNRMVDARLDEQGIRVNVAIDIAHGDSVIAYEAITFLRSLDFIGDIMSGSIATADAAARSVKAGCTFLRVGIGCGAACSTRLMTGVGVPQLSAVYLIAKWLSTHPGKDDITVIADGGIRYPGDAVKYLCAGAHAIMLGSLLSKTEESPGWTVSWPTPNDSKTVETFPLPTPKPILSKRYRGHASASFQKDHFGKPNRCPEGATSSEFVWDGTTVHSVLEEFRGGVASAISYLGLTDQMELNPEHVRFLRITNSAWQESLPRKDI